MRIFSPQAFRHLKSVALKYRTHRCHVISTPEFLVPFHLGLNKEIHHHLLLPHIPLARIPFGSPWDRLVTMATSSSSRRGKEKTGPGSSAQELSRKGPENYRPGIYTPKHLPQEESFTLNGTKKIMHKITNYGGNASKVFIDYIARTRARARARTRRNRTTLRPL